MSTTSSKKVAIILTGCGVYDGSEIHESTMLMLALSQHSIDYDCFAPNINQYDVINHVSGEKMLESRNVLIEAGRIARGNIQSLEQLDINNYQAICLPGGFGASKNLCSYAKDGIKLQILPQLQNLLIQAHKHKIPLVALCIAPVILAKLIKGAKLTLGNDPQVVEDARNLGTEPVVSDSYDTVIVDKDNLIFTTPCYMLKVNIAQIYTGIYNLVKTLVPFL